GSVSSQYGRVRSGSDQHWEYRLRRQILQTLRQGQPAPLSCSQITDENLEIDRTSRSILQGELLSMACHSFSSSLTLGNMPNLERSPASHERLQKDCPGFGTSLQLFSGCQTRW